MERLFEHLTEDDHAVLAERAELHLFDKGSTIVKQGSRTRRMGVILEGTARVEKAIPGNSITIASIGAGDVFGEMSFLEADSASASVVAVEPCKVMSIDDRIIDTLLDSVPGLAARFYKSLAVILSRRVRETSDLIPSFAVEEVPQVKRFHGEHTGHSGHGELPPEIIAGVDSFKETMLEAEQMCIKGEASDEEIFATVTEACEGIRASLGGTIERNRKQAAAIGAFVFRECFPRFMASRYLDRCYVKPRGYAGDYGTISIIYDEQPTGDGRLGAYVDRWALGSTASQSVRNRRRMIGDEVRRLSDQWDDDGPMTVTSLACGPAREIFDFFEDRATGNVDVTCVDVDEQALRHVADMAEARDVTDRIHLVRQNLIRLVFGRSKLILQPQAFMYSMGVIDYFEDRVIVKFLDWIFDCLRPGGTVALGNFSLPVSDRHFLDFIVEWVLLHRTPEDLEAVFHASKFGDRPVDVRADETGGQLIAWAQK